MGFKPYGSSWGFACGMGSRGLEALGMLWRPDSLLELPGTLQTSVLRSLRKSRGGGGGGQSGCFPQPRT